MRSRLLDGPLPAPLRAPDGDPPPAAAGGNPPAAAPPPDGADYFAALPAEDKQFVQTKGWDKRGVAGVLKDYRELEGKLGTGIYLPKDDADPAEWDKVYAKLGRPESPDKYELKAKDGLKVDGDLEKWFRGVAYKSGVPARQAAALFDAWNEEMVAREGRFVQQTEAEMSQFKNSLPAGRFDAMASAAKQAVAAFVPKVRDQNGNQVPDSKVLDILERQLGTAPMFQMFAAIGERISNLGAAPGTGGGPQPGDPSSPEAAQAELRKLTAEATADPKHPLMDPNHPEHAATVERRTRLYKIAHPT